MSEPGTIGVRDGYLLNYVSLHSEGQISHTGALLMKYYNNATLAQSLVDLGSLAVLRERIAPDPGEKHTYFEPVRNSKTQKHLAAIIGRNPDIIPDGILGITTAYSRDLHGDCVIHQTTSEKLDAITINEIEMECECYHVYVFDMDSNAWLYSGPETVSDGQKMFRKMFVIDSFRNDYAFLSNFFVLPQKLNFHGYRFTNSEAAFQAMKCPDRAKEFENLTPSMAKRLGRHVPLLPNWDLIKDDLMSEIITAKFTQFPQLRMKLMNTAPAVLIEGNSWGDTYWGVDGTGENHLGIILMQLRNDLAKV